MATIKIIKGNIFDSKCQVIVNPVNCLGYMGKGVALEFKYRFPEMFLEYKLKCEKNELFPGSLHLYKESSPWVLNFPTKID
jgi:O-acetyl-ADP-ribose deacetylase (regulator of RNase III)